MSYMFCLRGLRTVWICYFAITPPVLFFYMYSPEVHHYRCLVIESVACPSPGSRKVAVGFSDKLRTFDRGM